MSIIAVFKQKIKLFASRVNLSEMLSYSDFNIEDIGKQKTAVFIVIQDEKKTYHSLVTILIKQIYETLIDVAQGCGGALPIRTNFLLDEFANMPPLKDVTTMITAARSRLMRFTMIIQNFAQLNEVYGEQNAETIKGNCGNMIYLISTELRALEEISKMCGEIKVKTGKDEKEKEETRPLITISDLQKLKMNEVIIRRLRMAPFKTKLTPDYKMDWGRTYKKASIAEIIPRERREVKVFDVREFVKNKKKESGVSSPFGSGFPGGGMGFPPNPFMPSSENSLPFPGLFDESPISSSESKLDVDKILKNLDAKIAEIEAEEKRLAEEEENSKLNDLDMEVVSEKIDDFDTKNIDNQEKNDTSFEKDNFELKEKDDSFKELINSFDMDDFKVEPENNSLIEDKTSPENIDELISKIKEKSLETIEDNIKLNMDLKEENKYQEVSDDEFFDDFFDD